MELGQSSELNDEGGGAEEEQQQLEDWFPLGDLPQDCLVRILSQLMPRYVCRVALVSWAFSRVSRLDAIWEHLLPPQYQAILAQAYGGPPQFSSKRELYDCLCQQILLKDGNEGYWIDGATGGACYMLSAKALKIVWHDDPRYWEWRHRHGSRFHEVAYLIEVCWFSVSGYLDCRMPPGAYTVSFRLQLNDESDGWSEMPVNFLLSTSDGQHSQSQRYLNLDGDEDLDEDQLELVDLTSRRVVADDWMEYDVGEFTTMSIDEPIQIQFSMKDTEGNHWKRGLFLDGVVIRPSYLVPHYVSEEGE